MIAPEDVEHASWAPPTDSTALTQSCSDLIGPGTATMLSARPAASRQSAAVVPDSDDEVHEEGTGDSRAHVLRKENARLRRQLNARAESTAELERLTARLAVERDQRSSTHSALNSLVAIFNDPHPGHLASSSNDSEPCPGFFQKSRSRHGPVWLPPLVRVLDTLRMAMQDSVTRATGSWDQTHEQIKGLASTFHASGWSSPCTETTSPNSTHSSLAPSVKQLNQAHMRSTFEDKVNQRMMLKLQLLTEMRKYEDRLHHLSQQQTAQRALQALQALQASQGSRRQQDESNFGHLRLPQPCSSQTDLVPTQEISDGTPDKGRVRKSRSTACHAVEKALTTSENEPTGSTRQSVSTGPNDTRRRTQTSVHIELAPSNVTTLNTDGNYSREYAKVKDVVERPVHKTESAHDLPLKGVDEKCLGSDMQEKRDDGPQPVHDALSRTQPCTYAERESSCLTSGEQGFLGERQRTSHFQERESELLARVADAQRRFACSQKDLIEVIRSRDCALRQNDALAQQIVMHVRKLQQLQAHLQRKAEGSAVEESLEMKVQNMPYSVFDEAARARGPLTPYSGPGNIENQLMITLGERDDLLSLLRAEQDAHAATHTKLQRLRKELTEIRHRMTRAEDERAEAEQHQQTVSLVQQQSERELREFKARAEQAEAVLRQMGRKGDRGIPSPEDSSSLRQRQFCDLSRNNTRVKAHESASLSSLALTTGSEKLGQGHSSDFSIRAPKGGAEAVTDTPSGRPGFSDLSDGSSHSDHPDRFTPSNHSITHSELACVCSELKGKLADLNSFNARSRAWDTERQRLSMLVQRLWTEGCAEIELKAQQVARAEQKAREAETRADQLQQQIRQGLHLHSTPLPKAYLTAAPANSSSIPVDRVELNRTNAELDEVRQKLSRARAEWQTEQNHEKEKEHDKRNHLEQTYQKHLIQAQDSLACALRQLEQFEQHKTTLKQHAREALSELDSVRRDLEDALRERDDWRLQSQLLQDRLARRRSSSCRRETLQTQDKTTLRPKDTWESPSFALTVTREAKSTLGNVRANSSLGLSSSTPRAKENHTEPQNVVSFTDPPGPPSPPRASEPDSEPLPEQHNTTPHISTPGLVHVDQTSLSAFSHNDTFSQTINTSLLTPDDGRVAAVSHGKQMAPATPYRLSRPFDSSGHTLKKSRLAGSKHQFPASRSLYRTLGNSFEPGRIEDDSAKPIASLPRRVRSSSSYYSGPYGLPTYAAAPVGLSRMMGDVSPSPLYARLARSVRSARRYKTFS